MWRYAAPAAAFVVALALWLVLLEERRWSPAPAAFDIATWELAAVPGKWLYALGTPLRDDPPSEEALARYFALPDRGSAEGTRLAPVAEAAIEGRLDAGLRALGMPGVPGLSVWPPVDIELTGPPRVLAISPRSRIELASRSILRPGLSLDEAVAIEARVEGDGGTSAAVMPLGGLSTYPAIVTDGASYADTVEASAHEWVHHHLSFFPLGFSAPGNRETLRISETVADLAGDEIARVVLALSGDPTAAIEGAPGGSVAERARAQASRLSDRDVTLRALRLEVDALLLEGRVEQAERRMEEVRLELAERGINLRRLNQAYFAWTGTYAARGDSIDTLAGELREIRGLSQTLPRFIEAVRGATSRADIARVLDELRAAEGVR